MNNLAVKNDLDGYILKHISNEEYHASTAISKSGLDLIAKSPAHYHAEKINEDPELKRERTKSLDIGTAFHLLALEPESFDANIAVDADKYPTKKECGRTIEEQRAEFAAANAGKVIIRESDLDSKLRKMADSIRNHPAARYLLQGKGMVEASIFCKDTIHGVNCRVRPDWLREDGLIIDLKTTKDASASGFDKAIWNYRYHVQAAFYMDMYEVVTGKRSPGFVLIPVENTAPFLAGEPVLIEEGDDWLNIGRRAYLENIETYARCLETGKWPGYGEKVRKSMPMPWMNNLTTI